MFEDKVRAILGARALLDNNDPRIEQRWEELIILLSGDANLTLNFLQVCIKTELSFLSDVFEEVASNLQRKKYTELLYCLDQRYPSIQITEKHMD
ncbi:MULTISPECIES: hypothetical protein [Lysinibacillus]|uniref:hypothetical protein n=1 Tax=Lysinibacillus TaxID=400634 RepID=UPI001C2FAF44|nr:hypothetical protein [Lysinibacillus sp. GbtcB16]